MFGDAFAQARNAAQEGEAGAAEGRLVEDHEHPSPIGLAPLISAARLADAATLPLPQSHEISAPASATSPACFRSKIV